MLCLQPNHRPSRQVLAGPPSRDLTRHGCRVRAYTDVLAACPAMVGGQGPCSKLTASRARLGHCTGYRSLCRKSCVPTISTGPCRPTVAGPCAAWMPRKSLYGRTCGVSRDGGRARTPQPSRRTPRISLRQENKAPALSRSGVTCAVHMKHQLQRMPSGSHCERVRLSAPPTTPGPARRHSTAGRSRCWPVAAGSRPARCPSSVPRSTGPGPVRYPAAPRRCPSWRRR